MLSIGQERSRENAALAAEPGCAADSTRTKPLHSSLRDSERVSDSYNHRKAVAGALQKVPEAGGTLQSLTRLGKGENGHGWPEILPGGKAVLFSAGTGTSNWINAQVA